MNDKLKLFLFNYLLLCILEIIFGLLIFDNYLKTTLFNIFLFLIPVSAFITLINGIFTPKISKVLYGILYSILGVWFSIELVFKKVFNVFFSIETLKLSDQALKFSSSTMESIFKNIGFILLLFIPLILLIIKRKSINFERNKIKDYLILFGITTIGVLLFTFNLNLQKNDEVGAYYLYNRINNNALNKEKLGVLDSTLINLYRNIFGFKEKIDINLKSNIDIEEKTSEEIFVYEDNLLNIDFDKLSANTTDNNIKLLNEYMKTEKGTKQNKYTGIFKDKNLVYIVAESFNEIGVREDLTPTLYKLVNSGFVFNNFYNPNELSTIGGEFQALTGLSADTSFLSTWRKGSNNFPFGLATIFSNANYNTYAYHNHYYTFQDRNIYLKTMGFTNYKGCYNGMEKLINCKSWPESDVEMIDKTTSDYILSDKPFLAYYMSVSGHFAYNFSGNRMAIKNKDMVKDLNYSEGVKAYLATQIELDKALELLLKRLEANNKLDDTVIILQADHYPYGLTLNQINEIASSKKDSVIEVNKSNLIIWNNKLNTINIDKVSSSIDVIPTTYNLFGLEYDSRLIVGKDILSNYEGLAGFQNRSWITNKGKYFSSNNSVVSNETLSNDYIQNINSNVNNRLNISKLIMETNYYDFVYNNK